MHTVKRRLAIGFGLLLAVLPCAGCAATQPPAGTYTATGQKAFNADQLFTDIQALSDTAINMNATAGTTHLSDKDTALIRDFALTAGAGLQAYANGSGTLAIVISSYQTLDRQLSNDARINDKVRFALALVAGVIQNIPVQEEER